MKPTQDQLLILHRINNLRFNAYEFYIAMNLAMSKKKLITIWKKHFKWSYKEARNFYRLCVSQKHFTIDDLEQLALIEIPQKLEEIANA